MGKLIILPSNSDLNRGDQALVWETMEAAKKAGYKGEFYMLSENEDLTKQSRSIGIQILSPILKHPGRKFKSKSNNNYNIKLILMWGSVAVIDFMVSLMFYSKFMRTIMLIFLSDHERHTLTIMKECDACFVKGGGFIHSSGKLTDFYTIYYLLFHILLAQSLGKPIYVMPNSFGPFDGLGVKWLVRKVLSRCVLVAVRESISKEMLSKIGIESFLFPDLGFILHKNKRRNFEIEKLRTLHPTRKLVAITARPYRFPGSSDPIEKYKSYTTNMVFFTKWLYEHNYLPVFVEHTVSETSHESDKSCISEIVSNLRDGEFSIISNEDYTCKDLKAIYSEFDYVIGTRFHSVIFALSEMVPSIAITYGGNKGQGIMNDLGLSDYAISMSEFSFEKVKPAFLKLCEDREKIRIQLIQNDIQTNMSYDLLVNLLREKLL